MKRFLLRLNKVAHKSRLYANGKLLTGVRSVSVSASVDGDGLTRMTLELTPEVVEIRGSVGRLATTKTPVDVTAFGDKARRRAFVVKK